MTVISLYADQELPAIPIDWQDSAGATLDFSSGWTATVKVCAVSAPSTIILTKTSGITLAATNPNYLIEFTAADLATIVAALSPGTRGTAAFMYVYNRRTSDSKDAVFRPGNPITLHVWPAPA